MVIIVLLHSFILSVFLLFGPVILELTSALWMALDFSSVCPPINQPLCLSRRFYFILPLFRYPNVAALKHTIHFDFEKQK